MGQPWADHQPSHAYTIEVLLSVSITAMTALLVFKGLRKPDDTLRHAGVAAAKVKRALREIERKTFHIAGLLVPIIHHTLLAYGWSNRACAQLCWAITITGWIADVARLCSPLVARNWPMRKILREHEQTQLTGGCYFSLGCTLAISISPPSIAAASILFLVLGDMSAALIGVSFGGEVSVVKLGRGGKKSLEGSVAMFLVCFLVGCTVFASVTLREYPVFLGALAATLTELYEPLLVNDNLTIPVCASLAMQWGFERICQCSSVSNLQWLRDALWSLV